ncbi:DOMON domain protein [Necator americanus]|uniref:DOMON domain protein n=1 Tax=Necator americanus TaxID=51031 RepID=W2U056_NECAM|nr:DOMON domain protein [Necator americanus]ETN87304.1 DOMON domain protein [Necator americanus]
MMAPITTTSSSSFLLTIIASFSLITGSSAGPCIFREGPHQVIYGIRNGIVHFRIIIRGVPQMASGWTGIGFGNGMTDGLDTIIVRLSNGRISVTDEYVRGYTSSSPDRINNVVVHSSKLNNGVLSVTFSRPVNAMEYPYDSSLLGCQPWQFLVGLNRMGPRGEQHHHMMRPVHRTVCIDECRI